MTEGAPGGRGRAKWGLREELPRDFSKTLEGKSAEARDTDGQNLRAVLE